MLCPALLCVLLDQHSSWASGLLPLMSCVPAAGLSAQLWSWRAPSALFIHSDVIALLRWFLLFSWGFTWVFFLSLCYLSHFSAVLWPLPWHPLYLWLNFSIALFHVKASQVKLQCPKASVLWVPAPISEWCSLVSHSSSSNVSPPAAGPDKNSMCFCGVTLLRSVFWPKNPVFVKQLPPLPFPSHAPSGHSSIFSCGSTQLG